MNKIFSILLTVITCGIVASATPKVAMAAVNYQSGYYTNLCGSGMRELATANTCNKGCNTDQGTCTSTQSHVVKWTCDGNQVECRNNETDFAPSQSVTGASCGKTVQINVYGKKCRNFLGWLCSDSDIQDFMVWYSGDCPGASPSTSITPTPTTQASYTSSCDNLQATSGNNTTIPATVSLQAQASDTGGAISAYKFYFGDGQSAESTTPQMQHRYESSGVFTTRVDVKDSRGVWKTSAQCQAAITVQPLGIESQKSDCSDIFVLSPNPTQPNLTSTFLVTGYNNKGQLRKYKIDFGNGVTKEGDTGSFQTIYDTAGTYTVRGWILDTENVWKGGSGTCQKTLYVSTEPLRSQPGTGTPTGFTLIALASGVVGISLLVSTYALAPRQIRHRTHTHKRKKR